jgi:universal stress protein A
MGGKTTMAAKSRVPKIKKILVPTDFTPHSEQAIRYAAELAKKFGAGVIVMHVIEAFTYSVTDTIQVIDHYRALKTIAEPLLDGMRNKLIKEKIKTVGYLTKGSPYQEIVEKARQARVDLIVMGTHGRAGVTHLLLGSVAERVVRMAECPVLTVRG